MRSNIFLVLLFFKFVKTFANEAEDLKVCLHDLGCIQGTYMPGYEVDKFEAFMGIPYAKPPIGDLRFKNPEPISAWHGVLQTMAPKPDCLQKNYIVPSWPVSGEEDCLYLNLYRPMHRSSSNLPVLFYIYGGGFFTGSANPGVLGPEYFMDTEEVILVIVSYRLGPFGFLSTGDENMPGNFGLKDQNMALKWVHANIASFGGDPGLVTLFGHSAGGSAVHFHMLSPASSGLFQRGVIMSGNAIAPYVDILKDPYAQAVQLAESSGIANSADLSSTDLADLLRSMDAHTLLDAGDSLKFWHRNPLTNFRPIIERDHWSNAFLTEHPDTILKSGRFTHVPWMMGLVSSWGEGAGIALNIWESDKLRLEFNEDFDNLLTQMMEFPKDAPKEMIEAVMNMIFEEYFQGIHELNNVTVNSFMELFGDVAFYYPFYKSISYYMHYSDIEQNPVYLFKFNYSGSNSYSMVYTGGNLEKYGVVHFDDLLYLFRSPLIFPRDFEKDSNDAKMVKKLVGIYVDFAKNGRTFDKVAPCKPESFLTNGESICNYLYFSKVDDVQTSFENKFHVRRMRFWDKILGNHA